MDIIDRLQYEPCSEGLQLEAFAEIANLRTRLELDESGVDGIQCRDATIKLQADEIRKLRAKLEAVQRTVESYHEELAASQAREKVRLDALAAVVARMRETPAVQGDEFKDLGIQARAAMSLPADDSALRDRLRVERERCAKICRSKKPWGNSADERASELLESAASDIENRHEPTSSPCPTSSNSY